MTMIGFDGILDDQAVGRVDRLGGEVDRRWAELEERRTLPAEVFDNAAEAGLFELLDGVESAGPEPWFEATMRCAWWSGSLGWVCGHGSTIAAQIAVVAPGLLDAIRESCAAPVFAGTNAGLLELRRDGEMWCVTGKAGFVSGVTGATHVAVLGVETGAEPSTENLQYVLAPVSSWEIVEDWDPIGLRGTGSHSVRVQEKMMKAHEPLWAARAPALESRSRVFATGVAGAWFIGYCVAATQLGIARRAIDECNDLVADKIGPPTYDCVGDRATVRARLMHLEGRWLQAYGGCVRAMSTLWDQAQDAQTIPDRTRALLAACAHLANREAVDLVQQACQVAGTSMLSRSHLLARCHRDVQPLLGHVSANAAVLDFAAQRIRGEDPGVLVV